MTLKDGALLLANLLLSIVVSIVVYMNIGKLMSHETAHYHTITAERIEVGAPNSDSKVTIATYGQEGVGVWVRSEGGAGEVAICADSRQGPTVELYSRGRSSTGAPAGLAIDSKGAGTVRLGDDNGAEHLSLEDLQRWHGHRTGSVGQTGSVGSIGSSGPIGAGARQVGVCVMAINPIPQYSAVFGMDGPCNGWNMLGWRQVGSDFHDSSVEIWQALLSKDGVYAIAEWEQKKYEPYYLGKRWTYFDYMKPHAFCYEVCESMAASWACDGQRFYPQGQLSMAEQPS